MNTTDRNPKDMGEAPKSRREHSQRRRAERITDLEQRMPARFTARRNRRSLAVAGAGLLALLWLNAAVSWFLAPSDTAMVTTFVVLAVVVVVGIPVISWMVVVTRGATSLAERFLDERQVAERLRAFTVAHRISGLLIAVVAMASTILDPGLHLPSAAYFLVLFALFATHTQLPLLVAAWQAPDPPVDDEEPATDEPGQGAFDPPRVTDLEGRPAKSGSDSGC